MPAMIVAIFAAILLALTSTTALAEDGEPSPPPPQVIEIPAPPSPADPCGPTNASWDVPANTDPALLWEITELYHMIVTITTENTTFTDGETSHDYGTAPDSGAPCEPVIPVVKWTAFEKRCMAGTMTSGHRGMGVGMTYFKARRFAEDTRRSLRKALVLGLCSVETDYWETRDHRIVSHHDGTLGRMTNGTGRIRDRSWAYIRGLRSANGARVSTFAQMQWMLKKRTPWTCFRQQEIKRGALSYDALRRMVRMNNRYVKAPECVMYTSGERSTLGFMNTINPRSKLGLIHRSTYGRPDLSTVPKFIDRIMLNWKAVTPKYVKRALAAGFEVSARGVNTLALFDRMKRYGVKYIVTDRAWVLRHRR